MHSFNDRRPLAVNYIPLETWNGPLTVTLPETIFYFFFFSYNLFNFKISLKLLKRIESKIFQKTSRTSPNDV